MPRAWRSAVYWQLKDLMRLCVLLYYPTYVGVGLGSHPEDRYAVRISVKTEVCFCVFVISLEEPHNIGEPCEA